MLLLAAVFFCAQMTPSDARPSFEAVSVKPSGTNRVVLTAGQSVPVRLRSLTYSDRRFTCNTDLRTILREAYSVEDFQLAGPEWISTNTYEVTGLMPPATSRADARRRLQRMLEDRFGLRWHRESRTLSVYALTVWKNGFKGVPAEDRPGSTRGSGTGMLTASSITLDELAAWLSRRDGVPVLNQTAVAGRYRVDLHWTVDEGGEAHTGGAIEGGLASALQDQLGLRLERRKVQAEMFVIDHLEKSPSEN